VPWPTGVQRPPHHLFFVGIWWDEVEPARGCTPSAPPDMGGSFVALPEPCERSEVPLSPPAHSTFREGLIDLVVIRTVLPGSSPVEAQAKGQNPTKNLQG